MYALERLVLVCNEKYLRYAWQKMVFCGNRDILETVMQKMPRPVDWRVMPAEFSLCEQREKGAAYSGGYDVGRTLTTDNCSEYPDNTWEDREAEWWESHHGEAA